jgi:rSAM/selenodomain-associated transferase 1
VTGADGKLRQKRCAIAIMAKSPEAGRTKTRLSPFLAPDEARDLGSCFLKDMTANLMLAAREAAIDPYIAFAPAGSEMALGSVVGSGIGYVLADGSHPAATQIDGLGRCLLQAVHALFEAGYGAVGLLNADSPTLPTYLLVEAARRIAEQNNRLVLGPSIDGGYYLIVMSQPHADLFSAIDWSTDQVAAQTRVRAQRLGLDVVDLPAWYDVDDPKSLCRLIDELHASGGQTHTVHYVAPYAAPFTAGWMRDNGILNRLDRRFGR